MRSDPLQVFTSRVPKLSLENKLRRKKLKLMSARTRPKLMLPPNKRKRA
jgi:hypothetical protein